jgi:triacylglycerol lipase
VIPIVLHHGLILPGNVPIGPWRIGSFVGIDRALAERGHPLILTQVHPTAGVARRAAQLKQIVRDQLKRLGTSGPVILLAHSMGGLDARYMVAHLGMSRCVAAIVTLSTPHRGSPYADWAVRHLTRFKALQLLNAIGLDVAAGHELTTDACARFNETTPDHPDVRYYSVTAARPLLELSPLLYQPSMIVAAAEGPNDGLVSVRSGTWANHLETWPVDHFHILNRRFLIEWRTRTGDVRPMYLRILDRLAADGVIPPGKLPVSARTEAPL